jgi:hypothetical protein
MQNGLGRNAERRWTGSRPTDGSMTVCKRRRPWREHCRDYRRASPLPRLSAAAPLRRRSAAPVCRNGFAHFVPGKRNLQVKVQRAAALGYFQPRLVPSAGIVGQLCKQLF